MANEQSATPHPINRWARIVATILLGVEAVLAALATLPHVFGATDDQRISIPLAVFSGLALLTLVWFSFGVARGISMAHSGAIVAQVVIVALVLTGWLTWAWAALGVVTFFATMASYKDIER